MRREIQVTEMFYAIGDSVGPIYHDNTDEWVVVKIDRVKSTITLAPRYVENETDNTHTYLYPSSWGLTPIYISTPPGGSVDRCYYPDAAEDLEYKNEKYARLASAYGCVNSSSDNVGFTLPDSYNDQWEACRQQYADWHQKHSYCSNHEAVSFGGKKGFCKKCDADMEMDGDFVWRAK